MTSSSWVCPSDRELMLRSKLEAGWSCKSSRFQCMEWKQEKINEDEKKIILDVLSRAQKTEESEKKRIDKMVDRLKVMKRSARGNGQKSCILCNESFGLFALQAHSCQGCKKLVCNKCGVDTLNRNNETIWYCKICSETREVWKKSGSWFRVGSPECLLESNVLEMAQQSSNEKFEKGTNSIKQAEQK